MKKNIREAKWYPYAVAACLAVVLYVILTRFSALHSSLQTVFGFFRPLFIGCAIAYVINPLTNLINRTVFSKIKKEQTRAFLSNTLTVIFVLLLLAGVLMLMIPQLVKSVETFINNLDGYVENTTAVIEASPLNEMNFDLAELTSSWEYILDVASNYMKDNMQVILKQTVATGRNLFQWVIAFILSVYLLSEKHNLKDGAKRLLKATCGKERYSKVSAYLYRCDHIFNRYIVYNLIDAFIVGTANFLFMTISGMQYKGLVSVVVGMTNLIPTFGPIIGAVIGAFVLLLVKPLHALLFLIFTLILQFLDGYVIKPKLFGNSLGVSGLWILVGVVVGGNMFGVLGILLAIPVVTIIDFTYKEYFLPWLEKKNSIN